MNEKLADLRRGWSRHRADYAANDKAPVYRIVMRWAAEEYANARGWIAPDGSQYTRARVFRTQAVRK